MDTINVINRLVGMTNKTGLAAFLFVLDAILWSIFIILISSMWVEISPIFVTFSILGGFVISFLILRFCIEPALRKMN